MKKCFLILAVSLGLAGKLYSQETIIQYLSGTDKDHTVEWEFFCTKGRNSGKWTTIPVPSQWEMQGFGNYAYGWEKNKTDEQGLYRYLFPADKSWESKKIMLVFEGVMTDAEVMINGTSAGNIHQGGFYEFSYDITPLLQYDNINVLDVKVSKVSANKSIERAERGGDFWTLGGIYRPVYLKILPATFIDRIAVDAQANGEFAMQVFTQNTGSKQTIEAQVQDLTGRNISPSFKLAAEDYTLLKKKFSNIKTWNPEQPNLYQVKVSVKEGAKTIHTLTQRFGFRTAELRPKDGFYVNGVKVVFKGVNRHSNWPESGRTLSREVHLLDIALMKDMNMNAVRMSHYPPDKEFLDLCDSLGLFVIDELTGWQAAYDTAAGRKLVKEMVLRDVNHPSIVIWSNGNEGGWNRALDTDFHLYDPQKRFVMHPWEKFNGTDTKHYPDFNYITNSVLYADEVYFPTEFIHGLYDGGHGAALDDFWNEMRKHPYFAGGFLWVLSDEGIVRTDKDNVIDTYGNAAPDGIVGPHREKEGSYYAIKEIWSPVIIHTKKIPTQFDGNIEIENRFLYTNLSACTFNWKLVTFPKANEERTEATVDYSGTATAPSLAPGEKGYLKISLPEKAYADALYLSVTDENGKEIITYSWPVHTPGAIAKTIPEVNSLSTILVQESDQFLSVITDGINYIFEKSTGYLGRVISNNKEISFSGGPAFTGAKQTLRELKHYEEGNTHIVEPVYNGDEWFAVKWTFQSGAVPKMEYRYTIKGNVDFMGITFNYPEEKITGAKWLGRGPYHVWKNRLKGLQLAVWEKEYNNTVTGESWIYPEFKGWHSELYWVKIKNKESDFTIYTSDNNTFLQLLKPERPKNSPNDNTNPPFPSTGNIGFMQGISAIGTKFHPARVMGPQSQKNGQLNKPVSGCLWFDFR